MFLLWSSAMYGGHKKMNIAYSTRICAWMGLITEWMTGCLLENKYCLSVCMNDADLWMKDWLSIVEWILPICMHEWCWSLNEGLAVCCRMNTAYLYAWMALISEWMAGCWLDEYCLSVCMNGTDLWLNGWLLAEWMALTWLEGGWHCPHETCTPCWCVW